MIYLRMSQIKYLFIVVILCVVMAYMSVNFNVSFETDADFRELINKYKHDIVIIASDKYFPYKLKSVHGIIMSPVARLLCDPAHYIITNNVDKSRQRSIVNWSDGWIEVYGDRCNNHVCTNIYRNMLYGGSHAMTFKSMTDKKTGSYVDAASPGFLISIADHPDHKIKFYEREHTTQVNFTSVVTVQNLKIKSYGSVMLYVAAVQSDKKTLQQCVTMVTSLFTKSKKTAASMYPFVGSDKIGYLTIATVVEETADARRAIALGVSGCEVSDVTFTKRGIYYVYDFILYDESVKIAPIHRANGSGKSIHLTFLTIDNVTASVSKTDAVSIMQNDDAASYHGPDVESANEIHSDSEFEDVAVDNPITNVNLNVDLPTESNKPVETLNATSEDTPT